MIKFLKISCNDIISDPENAGESIAQACRRKRTMRVAGACDLGNTVMIVFEDCFMPIPDTEFIFSPFHDESEDGVAMEIRQRYEAGYSTLSSFRIAGRLWGLFARCAEEDLEEEDETSGADSEKS